MRGFGSRTFTPGWPSEANVSLPEGQDVAVMRAVEARDDRAVLLGKPLERFRDELLHVRRRLLARRAALDGAGELGQASPTIRSAGSPFSTRSFLCTPDSIVVFVAKMTALAPFRTLSSRARRSAPRPTIPTVSVPPSSHGRSGVNDREGVAGDQDEVGRKASLHRREGAVEYARLVGSYFMSL